MSLLQDCWADLVSKEYIQPPPRLVLDVGCYTGRLSTFLSESGYNVTSIDILPYWVVKQPYVRQSNVHFICGNFSEYNFKDTRFDIIVLSMALHCINSTLETIFLRCSSLIKNSGDVIVSDIVVSLPQIYPPAKKVSPSVEIIEALPSILILGNLSMLVS